MSEAFDIPPKPPPSAAAPRRGRPLLAWLVILGVIAFLLWRNWTSSPLEKQGYDLVTMRLQARYLVGFAEIEERFLRGGKRGRDQLYEQAKETINRGTYAQRLRFVVLAGELKGPDEAVKQLRQINERYHEVRGDPPAEEAETARLLDHLYTVRAQDANTPVALPEDQQDELRHRLGWFGELALTPPGSDAAARAEVLTPAYRTVATLFGVGGGMVGMGIIGLVLLVVLIVLYCLHRLRSGLAPGSPHHGIYAETFALYMLLFLGFSLVARYLLRWIELRQGTLALSGLAALGSLAALGWPVLRGIPWSQVRRDIGWHADRRPWLTPFLGLGCYAMALPLLFLAIILVLILTQLRDTLGLGPGEFDPSNAPGHPIVILTGRAAWWVWLEVLFVACVVAPIVEETMFRGVLYRHLRDASSSWRPALSVLFSAVVVSFLFAVIHPQGFLGVPPLMALALAFALMREWRGTLLPPMLGHAINNGVTTLMLFLMS